LISMSQLTSYLDTPDTYRRSSLERG